MATEWPVSKMYPVIFRSGGDTTSQAFGKHINEITRMYDLLNELHSGKLDSTALSSLQTELSNHKNSTNPHPNWNPATPVTWEKLNEILTGARMTTLLGKDGVSLPTSGIKNFDSAVGNIITEKLNSPFVGVESFKLQENGYCIFKSGLIIQWGYGVGDGKKNVTTKFEKPFTTFNIVLLTYEGNESENATSTYWLMKKTLSDFTWSVSYINTGGSAPTGRKMFYIAIGK